MTAKAHKMVFEVIELFYILILARSMQKYPSALIKLHLENVVAQSCPTLCYPVEHSPPGSFVHGIFQATIQEWVAIFFSSGSSPPRGWTWISCIAGRFFTNWATREAFLLILYCVYQPVICCWYLQGEFLDLCGSVYYFKKQTKNHEIVTSFRAFNLKTLAEVKEFEK